jgi:two-component system, NarL family, capsular synthesis sensor histidine kinase RcsC
MSLDAKAILIVDDNQFVACRVGHLVGRMGFKSVLASNGQEALNRLAEEQFAAVVSDVEMPVMGGFELARTLRLLYPEVPVVLTSASSMSSGDKGRWMLVQGICSRSRREAVH